MDLKSLTHYIQLIEEKLMSWLDTTVQHLPNFVVALLIVLVFSLLSRVMSKTLRSVLHKTLESRQIADLLAAIFKIIVMTIGIFVALDFVGLSGTVKSLLAGAGIVGLAIGFAFQDMTENLIAGIAMGVRKPFQIGDVIEADGVFGTVKTINLRNTLVENFYGQLDIVPNKVLFRNTLRNYSTTGERIVEVPVGISYADDIQKASEVLVEAINGLEFIAKKDETAVYAESFGDSSINLLVWAWIDYPGHVGFMQARHELVVTINNTLSDNDILIPFPIRTLDFGIKGGEKLDAMLSNRQAQKDQNQ
ncbi:mechanosensitive ion channel family protein [Psychrosphaera ytuae]|uniref:Small-conductance mechanosensitive channel n=1 Tax=Psychrosphaera ytuae TaxID=2820710 RepID=A0A975HJ74_9GAMM|nr:mechanosensitive ion channel family protein [Psychrosphaera ytuae]QTH65022.1 mechanosensitive ion channel family protein [Psychrosphaera ytuae]